jgi:hypothetical protein
MSVAEGGVPGVDARGIRSRGCLIGLIDPAQARKNGSAQQQSTAKQITKVAIASGAKAR